MPRAPRQVGPALVRGREYLIPHSPEPDDLPDRDVVAELRIQAYRARNKKTLGSAENVQQVVETIALYAAQGVVGGLAWATFPAVGRYLKHWLSKNRNPMTEQEVHAVVRRVVPVLVGKSVVDLRLTRFERLAKGDGWEIVVAADDLTLDLTIEGSGGLISGTIREKATG